MARPMPDAAPVTITVLPCTSPMWLPSVISCSQELEHVLMRFALFYEIPVARPWDADSERLAYQHTLEQAVAGERFGWDAFWTVEHHFLEEYSHCSNPEVLYGAIAALTERMRLGFGVRLMPKPYNHPVRTAEAVAVLDLISNGRVDLGTGRSSTRAGARGLRHLAARDARRCGRRPSATSSGCWTNDEYEFDGEYWSMPKRRVLPKPMQKPHPPLWGATSSEDGHRQVGELGLGLCSFAVGVSPEQVKEKIDIYRAAIAGCTNPIGSYVHDQASTFTMAVCAPTREEAWETARESFEWYPQGRGAAHRVDVRAAGRASRRTSATTRTWPTCARSRTTDRSTC